MPSKKRKYNARFPAGRIKKIMQTDEEVGKVAQAVPIIISRTLELFVESLLKKAQQVTLARGAKTLSPSHVKQCIVDESRFDFLRDLVKNIPDVSAAEEKELISAESSPNASRFSDSSAQRRIVREDSTSSSSCEVKMTSQKDLKAERSPETEIVKPKMEKSETVTSTVVAETAIDLTKKKNDDRPRMANFYQETLTEPQHQSVITVNPTYGCPQPSTSTQASQTIEPVQRIDLVPKPNVNPLFYLDVRKPNNVAKLSTPTTPVSPIINIDFSKNLTNPEIKVLDTNFVGVKNDKKVQRQTSKSKEGKRDKMPVNVDHVNSGNLQIDEDYDT